MAVITQTIQAGEQNNAVTEVQQALISLGATIATAEQATATAAGIFGPSHTSGGHRSTCPLWLSATEPVGFQCHGGTIAEHRGRGGIGQQRGLAASRARVLRGYPNSSRCRSF